MTLVKFNNGTRRPGLFSDRFWGHDLFGRLFEDVEGTGRMPAVNIGRTEDAYHLELAVPGMKKEDFRIELKDDHLILSAERKTEMEEGDKTYTRREFNYTSFNRSFLLPEDADRENIKAKYEDGVLKIDLFKQAPAPEEQPRKIDIA